MKKLVLIFSCFLVGCTASSDNMINVTVKDLTAPVIEVKNRTIEEGQSIEISDCYKVYDNADVKPTVELEGDKEVDSNKAGTYTIKITATDASKNTSESSFTITVEAKPEPTPTATPEVKSNASNNGYNSSQSNSNSNSSSSDNNAQSSNSSNNSYSNTTQNRTEYFLFKDGYDMNTSYQGCRALMNEYSQYSGSRKCDVVMNDDGTYGGYVFTYQGG